MRRSCHRPVARSPIEGASQSNVAHALLRAASPLMAMHGGRDESRGARVESAIPGTQECVRHGCRCIVVLARTLSSSACRGLGWRACHNPCAFRLVRGEADKVRSPREFQFLAGCADQSADAKMEVLETLVMGLALEVPVINLLHNHR